MSVVHPVGCRYSAWRDHQKVGDGYSPRMRGRWLLRRRPCSRFWPPVRTRGSSTRRAAHRRAGAEHLTRPVLSAVRRDQRRRNRPADPACPAWSTPLQDSVGCQWLAGGSILGPHFSFTWFRGSPIGRERKTEELSRTSVEDINIEGNNGFIAIGEDPTLGINLCEIGIQFNDDFIEWSVSFAQQPFPDACDVAKELTRQSIVNSK